MKHVVAKAACAVCAALSLLALCLTLIEPAGHFPRKVLAKLLRAEDPELALYQCFNVGRWMQPNSSHSPGTLVAKQPHAAAAARPLPSWVAACTSRAQPPLCWRWRAAPVDDVLVGPQGRCLPRRVEPAGLVELFRGRHLAFAGDSHERILHQHLAKALGGTGEESYHEDRTELIGSTGTRLDLWFRTLGGNLTAQVQNLTARGEEAAPPDLLLMGGGSWSILEEGRNVTRWEESLDELAPAVRRYLAALRRRGARPPVLVWATTPVRVKGRAARPVELPAELIPTFNAAAVARMVQPAGPFVLLDLYGITRECYSWCIPDGQHGGYAVNAVAIQVLANIYAHARQHQEERWGGLLRDAVALFRRMVKPRVMPT